MSNGDDVLDNWEEIDEAGLCMTLQTKLQTAPSDGTSSNSKPASTVESKMKLLQRPQSLQENNGSAATASIGAPKQIMIAKKPVQDVDVDAAPVMMVLHKSASEYDATSYANPINNQTVKILRRPAQSDERRDSNGIRPKQPIKTLQQREQEYAQARLRILGSAKNPEDDKPTTSVNPTQQWQTDGPSYAANFNNGGGGIGGGGVGGGVSGGNAPGMHRSSSAPKMSQSSTPMYKYNNYYQAGPPTAAAMSYIYSAPMYPHQRMPPYVAGPVQGPGPAAANPPTTSPQQSWSPVVGGSVSAALLRQQSMHSPSVQHQQQAAPPPPQYGNSYNDNVLRLPRGPCPNGTIGFQMRR